MDAHAHVHAELSTHGHKQGGTSAWAKVVVGFLTGSLLQEASVGLTHMLHRAGIAPKAMLTHYVEPLAT